MRAQRLVELNVERQCLNVYADPVVQRAYRETGFPHVSGAVYDIKSGLLKQVHVDLPEPLKAIYDIKIS